MGQCGLSSSGNIENNGQPNPAGSYLENTIIVQYDPQVQEVWDQGGRSSMLQFIKNELGFRYKSFECNLHYLRGKLSLLDSTRVLVFTKK